MTLYLCPGVHDRTLSDRFCRVLDLRHAVVLPTDTHVPYSPLHVLDFARRAGVRNPCFVAFSAGVVGAMGAAWMWQQGGRSEDDSVRALIALDGWGVPLFGDFPIHRLSHDAITDRESHWLGMGGDRFYADPSVSHLDLWGAPERAQGWRVGQDGGRSPTDAATFLRQLLQDYDGG